MAGFFSQFSPDQLRAGFARNAASLGRMAAQAARTGRRVNGFTAEYLAAKAAEYLALSLADDATITAHASRPVPPYAERAALREATLRVGRKGRR